jgi:hypothetical protein
MAEREEIERSVVGFTEEQAFFIPGKMIEENGESVGRLDPFNAFTGLQWYQAFNNEAVEVFSMSEKLDKLGEIFKNPNNLTNLARLIEMQTGTNGLIRSMLGSLGWAEWEIYPQLGNVTESFYGIPHISSRVTLGSGKPISAISIREMRLDEDKRDIVGKPPKFGLFRGRRTITSESVNFRSEELRYIDVLPGKIVQLLTIENEEMHNPETALVTFTAYELNSKGNATKDKVEREDKKAALIMLGNQVERSGDILYLEKDADVFKPYTDWNLVRDELIDSFKRIHLLKFLLPYCDMPTTDGHVYVLSENSPLITKGGQY